MLQPCYWRTNNFFSTHRQGVPYKAENWHTWSYEQYFPKNRFLDTCRCAENKPLGFYNREELVS